MEGTIRAATGLYRKLLVLYPVSFRREYGPLMIDAFEQMCAEATAEGGSGAVVWFWGHTLFDLAGSLLVEHLDEKGRWMMTQKVWVLWVLASIVGWLSAGCLLLPRLPASALPVGAALVSALHVLLLQRFVAPAGWWWSALPLTVGSWLLPLGLFSLAPWLLSGLPFPVAFAGLLLVSAALVGLSQGFALRQLVRSPWLWPAVPTGALLAAAATAMVLMNTLLPLAANLVARGTITIRLSAGFISPPVAREMGVLLPLLYLVVAVLAGAVYGLVMGAGFVLVGGRLRDRRALSV